MSLDDVLNGNADELLDSMAAEAQQSQEQHAGDDASTADDADQQVEQQTKGEETQKPVEKPADAPKDAPPAPENEHHVPRKALEDERRKRQQLEQELAQMRQAQQAPNQPQQNQEQQLPPEVAFQQQITQQVINERLNMSEMILRQQQQDVDTVIERFQQEAQKNPALGAQLQTQTHPWQWAYDYAKRLMLMDEIGSDPEAYKQRLREEVLAEVQQQSQQQQQPSANPPAEKPNIPQSLAGARSTAARSAPVWTGSTPLEDIIK